MRTSAIVSSRLHHNAASGMGKVPIWMRNQTPDYDIGLKYQNYGGKYQRILGF